MAPTIDVLLMGLVCAAMIKGHSTLIWRSSTGFNNRVATQAEVTSPVAAKHALDCGRKCEEREDCNSVFFDTTTNQCWPQRSIFMSASDTSPRAGFRYYRIVSVSCPLEAGYVVHRQSGSCFRPVEDSAYWWHARDICAKQNGTLAILDTVKKMDFLIHFFITNPQVYVATSNAYMIGASRPLDRWGTPFPSTGPDFIWLNNKTVSLVDTAPFWWRSDHESSSSVLVLRPSHGFKLDDRPENDRRRYVCERAFSG